MTRVELVVPVTQHREVKVTYGTESFVLKPGSFAAPEIADGEKLTIEVVPQEVVPQPEA